MEHSDTISKNVLRSKTNSRLLLIGTFFCLLALSAWGWMFINGPIGKSYEPAYKTLEPVLPGKPDWFMVLSQKILYQEADAVGARVLWGKEMSYRVAKAKHPQLFVVPPAWFELVANTSDVQQEELSILLHMASTSESFDTNMAAQWLKQVANRIDRERVLEQKRVTSAMAQLIERR